MFELQRAIVIVVILFMEVWADLGEYNYYAQ